MHRSVLKSKIHRARVTETDLTYEGSLTLDRRLLEAADIHPYEQVQVVNITNGERLVTYAIPGDTGAIKLNGAAARLGEVDDIIIVLSFALFDESESVETTIVHVDETNTITSVDSHTGQ